MIHEHVYSQFVWGKSDCGFWADVILAMTGWDPVADGRGYDGPISARRALKQAGYDTVYELVEDRLVQIPVAHAIRGDIVIPRGPSEPLSSPFVLDGAQAFSKSLSGPAIISRTDCTKAFAF